MMVGKRLVELEQKIEAAIDKFEKGGEWQVEDVMLHKIDISKFGERPRKFLNDVSISIIRNKN